MLILPPSSAFFPVLLGIEWSQFAWVFPFIRIMSPLASGSLIGFVSGGFGALSFGGIGLCFMRKSLRAPREKEAMAGRFPRNRSSSLWYEMLSEPEA